MGVLGRISKAMQGAATVLAGLDTPAPLPATAPTPSSSQVARYPWVDRYARQAHPGFGLTPKRIVDIFLAAEAGFPAEQCDLFDDVIERNAQLRSQVQQRIGAVAGKGWIIEAGGRRPQDIKAAELLEQSIVNAPNFGDMVAHQLRAQAYGFMGSEIQWDLVNGVIAPVWFANERARRFRFDARDQPRLLTEQNRTDGEPLDPGRWIFSRAEGECIARSGFMRSVVILSYFKSLSLRDWVVWIERFGLPDVWGKYREGAKDDEKDELLEMVKMLGKDGSAIFSDACEIVIDQAKGGAADGPHASLMDRMDAEITKLITGSVLMADGADGGSFAQANAQKGVRFDIIVADEKAFGDRTQMDIGKPFVAFNGLNAAPPRVKVHVVMDSDPATRATTMVALAGAGMDVSKAQIRQEFQLKPPLNDDDRLEAPVPPPVPGEGGPPAGAEKKKPGSAK
jgi:phage gp29-like protein